MKWSTFSDEAPKVADDFLVDDERGQEAPQKRDDQDGPGPNDCDAMATFGDRGTAR